MGSFFVDVRSTDLAVALFGSSLLLVFPLYSFLRLPFSYFSLFLKIEIAVWAIMFSVRIAFNEKE